MIIDLIKYPVITEKSVGILEKAQYTFDVDLKLNKRQIKKLIQDLFQVDVIAINTHRLPKKRKIMGASKGYRPSYKRVIITLKSKQKIGAEAKKLINIFP
uniref:Large ribosomal subunit protein uL23c n=1 Tax=Prasiolopsis wulf-kochii TaxID=3239232 RepID=A0A097KJY6_9CHLO|nr:ribosomal protein L23 [Prasiolopsis sp. SAG 84.81]